MNTTELLSLWNLLKLYRALMTVKYQWWLVQNITGRETVIVVIMLEGTVSNVTDISFK